MATILSARSLTLCALAACAVAACDGDPGPSCPSIQVLVDGRCVDIEDDTGRGRPVNDTGTPGDVADQDSAEPPDAVNIDDATADGVSGEDADDATGGQLCTAAARRCRGTVIVECAADGMSETDVETCPVACANGQCVDGGCVSDGKEYLGCGFFATYLDNEAPGQGFGIAVSNPNAFAVDVSVATDDGLLESERIDGGDLHFFSFDDPSLQLDGSSLGTSAYRVGSSAPVTVHQFNPPNNLNPGFSTDASLLLPASSLDADYLVMGWSSGDDLGRFAGLSARSYVTIVAVNAGSTDVTVLTPTGLQAGSGVAFTPPGGTLRQTLAQGQVLTLMADRNDGDDPEPDDPADLTGMRITASAPVAVFSGSEASYVPDDVGPADHMEQQIFPVSAWGSEYHVARFSPRGSEDDVFRVMVRDGGTTLRTDPPIAGVDGRTLSAAGDAVEFVSNVSFHITADGPISVGQFMVGSLYPGIPTCTRSNTSGCAIPIHPECDGKRIGDPAFLLPVPTDRVREDYIVYVPEGFVENYASTTAPAGTVINVDGAATPVVPTAIGGSGYEVRHIPLTPGVHRLDALVGFGVSVYGYGCDVSYAYPGGLDLSE